MVKFVSLFLGLVVGYQTVAVQVTDPVRFVQILLDGQEVGTLEAPLWRGQFDLGAELRPHELTAVAFDDQGVELDSSSQWLNLPRQPAETTILLESDEETHLQVARVTWKSLTGDQPSAVHAEFDGQILEFEDPHAIRLPPFDPELLHFLRVELEFAGFVSSSAEVTFGGTYADQINTELTAFPVVLSGRKSLPPDSDLQDGFLARGDPLRVAAIEKGQVELIVVRDQSAWPGLRTLRNLALTQPGPVTSRGTRIPGFQPRWFGTDRQEWNLWTFRFLWPVPRRIDSGAGPYDLFSHSAKIAAATGSLHGWLTTIEQPTEWTGTQRLADAVAVAAVTVAGSNRRRGVLLVLGDSTSDASEASPEVIRRYLASLAVPLFVWAVNPVAASQSPWGPASDVSTPKLMTRATKELFRDLEAQRIVWLEGLLLPQQITLAPSLEGVSTISRISTPELR